jgi:Caspase domain
MRRMFAAALALVAGLAVLAGLSREAVAQKRVALVIGNGAYTKVPALPNPSNDAAAVEKLLRAAGFEYVQRSDNLKLTDLRKALRDFSAQVAGADIAVVFFAGHGIEVNGTNYLIPVDAVLEHDVDVQDEAFALDRVSQALEPAKRLRLIVLDACRDNPFVRSMRRTVAGRSIGRGLAAVEVLSSDTLIAYAAKAGYTAADGTGKNSPYTLALLNHLTTPGLDVRLALGRVRDEVLKSTSSRQEPWVYGSLGGSEITLVASSPLEVAKKVEPTVPGILGLAAAEWDTLRTKPDIAELEGFAARHKGTYFADLARARIEDLKQQHVVPPKPTMEPRSQAANVGNYAVDKSNLVGEVLSAHSVTVDPNRPESAIAACTAACDPEPQCLGFDLSVHNGRCYLYKRVDKKIEHGGFISGVRSKQ